MKKEEFYNEHVRDTVAYKVSLGNVDEKSFLDELDNMYNRGVVSISKFNYRDGMDISSPEAAATDFMHDLSFRAVDSFLKSSAVGIADGEEGNQYMVRVIWRHSSGKSRMAVTKIALDSRDRDNDHIIEQRLCDKYVNTYEHKVENARYHCYELNDMLRFPEMRSFMLGEAKQFLNENYRKEGCPLVKDKSDVRVQDVQVWMVPDDHRSRDVVQRGKGR